MHTLSASEASSLDRLLKVLRPALERYPAPALARLRQACEVRLASSQIHVPPLWQAHPDLVASEQYDLERTLGTPGKEVRMGATNDGGVDLEGELRLADDTLHPLTVHLPRLYPAQPPEVFVGHGEGRERLALNLQSVWEPEKRASFAVEAAVRALVPAPASGNRPA